MHRGRRNLKKKKRRRRTEAAISCREEKRKGGPFKCGTDTLVKFLSSFRPRAKESEDTRGIQATLRPLREKKAKAHNNAGYRALSATPAPTDATKSAHINTEARVNSRVVSQDYIRANSSIDLLNRSRYARTVEQRCRVSNHNLSTCHA